MFSETTYYKSVEQTLMGLPSWCKFLQKLGEVAITSRGLRILLVCPEENFSTLFLAMGALRSLEVNKSLYLKMNPCVFIADSRNENCAHGKKYLFDSEVYESNQHFFKFIGPDLLSRSVSSNDFYNIVIPQKDEDRNFWLGSKIRTFKIPSFSERDVTWKSVTIIGNKRKLLNAANQKWFYEECSDFSISDVVAIEGLVENTKAHASIRVQSTANKNEQSENFEIWSGKIPPIENKSDRSLIVCLDRTTHGLNEQIETFINSCRILGQRGLRPLTLEGKPVDHPLSSILKQAPPSLGVCAFGYMD
ncbi:hypothetical protein D0C16_17730 [Cellvibrio sp. KY-GH-1]|nr:hypothetical protein D0C16_17730 [Cellvibrio sp. KY-GH-1]